MDGGQLPARGQSHFRAEHPRALCKGKVLLQRGFRPARAGQRVSGLPTQVSAAVIVDAYLQGHASQTLCTVDI